MVFNRFGSQHSVLVVFEIKATQLIFDPIIDIEFVAAIVGDDQGVFNRQIALLFQNLTILRIQYLFLNFRNYRL